MKLSDLLDLDALEDEISAGNVTRRFHPEFPELAILNYTDKCQWENRWNDITRQTRGLIYNTETERVVARSFQKFFNLGDERNVPQLDPNMEILGAFNKFDGSLGIVYPTPDGKLAVATRGSFASEQAIHATELLQRAYADDDYAWFASWIDEGQTPVVEIIYPDNRIVLDYGDDDKLVLLGTMDIETGAFYPADHPEDSDAITLAEVLSLPPRENAEGYVIWLDQRTAVKLKQADYLSRHRIISSLNRKEIWRQLQAGTFHEFVVALPDEFHEWAQKEADSISIQFDAIYDEAHELYGRLIVQGFYGNRKDQALYITSTVPASFRGLVFSLLDGKDIEPAIWKMVEPKGN